MMPTLFISVMIKNVYGVSKIYPVGETAQGFCDLLGQKTLTEQDIQKIKALGYKVLVQPSDVKEL